MLLDTRVRKKVIRNRQSAKKVFWLTKNFANFLFPNFFLKMIRVGVGFARVVNVVPERESLSFGRPDPKNCLESPRIA